MYLSIFFVDMKVNISTVILFIMKPGHYSSIGIIFAFSGKHNFVVLSAVL